MRKTWTGPAITLPAPIKWSGGRVPSAAAGSRQSASVQQLQIAMPSSGLLQAGQSSTKVLNLYILHSSDQVWTVCKHLATNRNNLQSTCCSASGPWCPRASLGRLAGLCMFSKLPVPVHPRPACLIHFVFCPSGFLCNALFLCMSELVLHVLHVQLHTFLGPMVLLTQCCSTCCISQHLVYKHKL